MVTDQFTAGRYGRRLFYALAALILAGCSQQPLLPLASSELTPVEPGNFDHVLMPPGERLPQFSRVYIEAPEVSMSDYWLRDRRTDYTERDLDRIREDYGELLTEALRQGLERETQLVFTDTPEEAEVVFRPTLRALNIYAPDLSRPGFIRHYTREAGNATFDLVVLTPAGEVLGQFIDHRETQSYHGRSLEWTNRVTNYHHFSRLMDRWTRNLSTYLLIGGVVPAAEF
ncbi:hypothetical protein [Marinimicrobium sp. C2-29]|uniref:hypothetical protein n=1 Tax=Marinimicrobium sp. C2-29 TaxID=3139825 RepID=UPI003138D9C3